MDAKEYLTERNRMCDAPCSKCVCNDGKTHCVDWIEEVDPDQAIAIVSEWSKAHPRKTYKDDFLKRLPNSIFVSNMETSICRNAMYGIKEGKCHRRYEGCYECWIEPMEV